MYLPNGTVLDGALTLNTVRAITGGNCDEADHGHYQAIQAGRGARGAVPPWRSGHDRHGSQRLWPPEGPHGDLSRRGICRELPAQTQDRSRRERRDGRSGHRRHHRQGEDRTDRRRKDLRHAARIRRAHPHRRNGRRRALGRGPIQSLVSIKGSLRVMRIPNITRIGLGAATCAAAWLATANAAFAAAPPYPLNSGDTAWMITSSALVLMMTVPGLALFYGGMVRKKNVLATLAQSFGATCIITVLWMVVGYSIAFTPHANPEINKFIGSFNYFMLGPMALKSSNPLAATIPESVFMFFQMTFAIITPALIAGALADRMKFSAFMWFMSLWLLLVYCPIAHWVWGGGWLGTAGALDYAGGSVVHLNAGTAALVTCLVLGKRTGYGTENMAPHNLVLSVIGASLLWVGWFGFNAGSAVTANVNAGMAAAATQIATAAAALGWMFA